MTDEQEKIDEAINAEIVTGTTPEPAKPVAEPMETEEEIPLPEEEDMPLTPEEMEAKKDKKIKNLISLTILLAGLFVGSLFVDIVQLVKGGGFSEHALSTADVFAGGGKTWVAYTDPIVTVQIVNDSTCGDACKPDEALVGLKRVMPTMLTQSVDVNSAAGKALIAKFGIKTVPAFIFSKDVENVDLFTQAQSLFTKVDDQYILNTAQVGLPVGKYIAAPAVSDQDIKLGTDGASVTVVDFSDFSNPSDATAWQSIVDPMLKDYNGKIQFVFKNYFQPGSTIATTAALAGECANEQQKFAAYADKVFASQAAWSKQTDPTATLESYAAQLGLNGANFNQCLSTKKYNDQLTQSTKDGQDFSIQATPSLFVGSNLQPATAKYADVKTVIDQQLGQ